MLSPKLIAQTYVFCTTNRHLYDTRVISFFKEERGISYIIEQDLADQEGLHYSGLWSLISLGYQSALEMVGLTAHISSSLAMVDIPCNIVAGYYHDHIFVPKERAEEALQILTSLPLPT